MKSLRAQFGFTLMALMLCVATLLAQPADAPKLPAGLADLETQLIRREQGTKGHVEAVVRVADARLAQALKQSQDDPDVSLKQMQLYGELMVYADGYARQLPSSSVKERNRLLKIIEQAIFKQQRTMEGTRQELPFDYREATEKLVADLKRIRTRALNDILGNGEIIK